ncbi:MAG TPA: MarR family transcriptional regulator, partial [Ramlibacter sp.]|nr:MarR family transcriptional regulator [Ramlibacter sp.]
MARRTAAAPVRRARRSSAVEAPDPAAEEPQETDPEHSLQRRVAYRFSILANLSARCLAEMYTRRFGITMADWKTLAIVGHYEPVFPGWIARRTSMVPERVSRALDRLMEKGLVDRTLDREDRRRIVVTLSSRGRKAFAEIEAVRTAMEEELLGVLSAQEREALFAMLDKLDAHARDA